MAGSFVDILIFAVLAALIFFKLFNVLGRRTGHEQPTFPMDGPAADNDDQDTVVPLRRQDQAGDLPDDMDSELKAGIVQIQLVDGSFDLDRFLDGARSAFGMILDAFHSGELQSVRQFLDRDVYRSFAEAIEQRDTHDAMRLIELVTISKCEPLEAEMDGRHARVTVRFESEQTDVTKDSEDRIVAGDPTKPVRITDIWTFARDTRSRDPNWLLAATRNPN